MLGQDRIVSAGLRLLIEDHCGTPHITQKQYRSELWAEVAIRFIQEWMSVIVKVGTKAWCLSSTPPFNVPILRS